MESIPSLVIRVAKESDHPYAETITNQMAASAQERGTGIAKRSPLYIQQKMSEGKAIIALSQTGEWVGFCYIEAWGHEKFVANSGLIVSPKYRGMGVAKEIKHQIFELSRKRYPNAKVFGLTTGLAVMKINSELGYRPVTYSELTDDEAFWEGCKSCVNYEILKSKVRKNCLCTAMLYDPNKEQQSAVRTPEEKKIQRFRKKRSFQGNFKLFERWVRYKKHIFLNKKAAHKKAGTYDKVLH